MQPATCKIINKNKPRMELSIVHTSARAADVAKLLLLTCTL